MWILIKTIECLFIYLFTSSEDIRNLPFYKQYITYKQTLLLFYK